MTNTAKQHPVWAMIESFTELYPDEEYGFAHIVLSDQNLDDDSINYCLNERDTEHPHSPVVTAFLNFLLSIPEAERGLREIE